MSKLNCSHCGVVLSGGIDTFGQVGTEMCCQCYFGEREECGVLHVEDSYEASCIWEQLCKKNGYQLRWIWTEELGAVSEFASG
jgi:hypothetical protein